MPHHRDPVYGKFNKKLDPILLFKPITKQKIEVFLFFQNAHSKEKQQKISGFLFRPQVCLRDA